VVAQGELNAKEITTGGEWHGFMESDFFLEELFFQRKYNPQIRDPTHDVQVRGELISRGQCIAATDGVITEEWIGMDRAAALAWSEKPRNVPGRSEENHDRTHDDRSCDRILNPRHFDTEERIGMERAWPWPDRKNLGMFLDVVRKTTTGHTMIGLVIEFWIRDILITEEWIGMEKALALAWSEKPRNVPGRSEENHDRTHDGRSWDRILNPRHFDYDVLMITEDHSHTFAISLSSPYPL